MSKQQNLIGLIKKLDKVLGSEEADNTLAGMLIMLRCGKDYFWIKDEIQRILKERSTNVR